MSEKDSKGSRPEDFGWMKTSDMDLIQGLDNEMSASMYSEQNIQKTCDNELSRLEGIYQGTNDDNSRKVILNSVLGFVKELEEKADESEYSQGKLRAYKKFLTRILKEEVK